MSAVLMCGCPQPGYHPWSETKAVELRGILKGLRKQEQGNKLLKGRDISVFLVFLIILRMVSQSTAVARCSCCP